MNSSRFAHPHQPAEGNFRAAEIYRNMKSSDEGKFRARLGFRENEYGWFMRVYGMSFVSSEILKPEPRKHKKIKAQSSEVGTNYRPK